jgi:predicted Zn-dependent protease
LMRKSNIVTEAGTPGHGLGLANAALNAAANLTPSIRAVSLRQKARAHALLHERSDFERSIDEALANAQDADKDSDSLEDPARYCTPSYVTMEAGASWTEFGQPDRAIAVFRDSLDRWPERSQVRDRGLCLATLSTAYAAQGDAIGACEAVAEALAVARSTGSARIRSQLVSAYERLRLIADDSSTGEVKHQLAQLAAS